MGLPNLKVDTELRIDQCCVCGVWHAIPEIMFNHCYQEGGFWNCPNGHSIGFGEGSLKKQLEKEKKRRKWAEQDAERARINAETSERRRIAQKGATTRLKKRIKAGICPCCKRHFKQLASHMTNKHPEFNIDKEA